MSEEIIMKTCTECKISKPLNEFHDKKDNKFGKRSQCKKCRVEEGKKYRENHKEKISKHGKEYYEMCGRKMKGSESMHKNKNCSSYLGVVIAERLCKHLFKNVEVMPYGNTGFDILCNKNKKIDVKSGCITLQNNKYSHWGFKIDRNMIADFFLCVAFDNRTELNPLHLWMIPGSEINHLTGISIRPSTLHKWNQWERSIEEVQMCCTEMRIKQFGSCSTPHDDTFIFDN